MALNENLKHRTKPKSPKAVSREFARAAGFEVVKASSIPYDEVARNFRRLERTYLQHLVGHPSLALEIRRRVSEHLLEQAILHECSQQACRSRLSEALRLGFTNIEQEAHYCLLYARGALARGHRRIAKKTASEMVQKLHRSLKKRRSLLGQQCLMVTQKFLDRLEDGGQLTEVHG
jgi:predicted transcriptional regulator